MRSIKIDENTVALIFGTHSWGNSRKGNLPALLKAKGVGDEQAFKENWSRLTHQLIVSNEYDAVKAFMVGIKQWIVNRSVPSFFRDGCFLMNVNMVTVVDDYLKDKMPELLSLIDTLIAAYPQRIQEARAILEPNGQFDFTDYPTLDDLRESFYWDYQWVTFTVPEGLPPGIREAQLKKMSNMWEESATLVTIALREGFTKLVKHAVSKLAPNKSDKKKVIRDTFVPNIIEFLETFNSRNITNDTELATLVAKARKVMTGIETTKDIKDSVVQKVIRREFEKIEGQLNGMIIDRPRRAFDLRGEEE